MSEELSTTKESGSPTDLSRRQLGVGLLVALGGGLAVANTAEAFTRSQIRDLAVASRILEPYGLAVGGFFDRSADPAREVLITKVTPLAATEYRQVVTRRTEVRGIVPCVKTSHFEGMDQLSLFDPDDSAIDPCWLTTRRGDVITSTHFHPNPTAGAPIPCVRTTIEGHTLATHELLDADQGGIDPCWRSTAEMLEGGQIGTITAVHLHANRAGEIVPCIRTTIEGHSLATHELLDTNAGASSRA